jgi:hypothetical protein
MHTYALCIATQQYDKLARLLLALQLQLLVRYCIYFSDLAGIVLAFSLRQGYPASARFFLPLRPASGSPCKVSALIVYILPFPLRMVLHSANFAGIQVRTPVRLPNVCVSI